MRKIHKNRLFFKQTFFGKGIKPIESIDILNESKSQLFSIKIILIIHICHKIKFKAPTLNFLCNKHLDMIKISIKQLSKIEKFK